MSVRTTPHEVRVGSRNEPSGQTGPRCGVDSRNGGLGHLPEDQLIDMLERHDRLIFGSPKDREAGRRVARARQAARVCARCEADIAPHDVVYRAKRYAGRFFGRPVFGLAPVCEECAPTFLVERAPSGYATPYGYYRRREVRCGSCRRLLVYEAADHDWRVRAFCSKRCRWAFHNQERSESAAIAREKACEVCGEAFTATRIDAKACSPACKQKAYRQRKKEAGA